MFIEINIITALIIIIISTYLFYKLINDGNQKNKN
jgi:flagellar biogenesis protein FliO